MTLQLVCQSCGYKQYYIDYGEKAARIMQSVFVRRPDLVPCPKCKGVQKLSQIKFKDIVRLKEKFPLKKVIRTFLSVDNLVTLPDVGWAIDDQPDEPLCPKCGKGLCNCGDPEVTHCSDSRCGWSESPNPEAQL